MVSENKPSIYKINFSQLKTHSQWGAAEFVLKKLHAQGYEALIAGGAVRDLLMGRIPGDMDIATKAKPDQVEKLFPQTVAVGKAFGVIRVIHDSHSIEVATYRKDLEYQDGRRPEGVIFTHRIEDAKRRDFTINALFYDPFTEILYDDIDGKKDIEAKLLRCVGESSERFHEDELRRLRLVRFVSQLGFQIESETLKALETGIEGLQKVSKERITEEIGKMWMGRHLPEAFEIFQKSGMAVQVDPAWGKINQFPVKLSAVARQEKQEAWVHYFSFFFEEENLKNRFKLLKLSKDIEKFVDQVHQAYKVIPEFLKSRVGQQKFLAGQKGFLLGFKYYILLKISGDESQKFNQILKKFEDMAPLPEPLVKALHIQNSFQGPALGKALKDLYVEQLDQDWSSLDQALDWLKGQG